MELVKGNLICEAVESEISRLTAERDRLSSILLSPNTERSYRDSWRRFATWCDATRRECLPASAETAALWATAELSRGLKVSAVATRLSGVVHFHRLSGLPSPFGPEVHRVLNGARRLRREAPVQKRSLTVGQLWKISRLMDTETARGLRDRAIIVLGFAGAFRRSEIAGLDLSDVDLGQKGLMVNLRWSKTDQLGQGRTVAIFRGDRADTCPVRTLTAWLKRRGELPGPLFLTIDNGDVITDRRLGSFGIVGVIKRAVARIGLDPHHYAGHSLRAGYVTAAGENGATELAIMNQTGHKSIQMVHRYFRPATAFSVNPLAHLL